MPKEDVTQEIAEILAAQRFFFDTYLGIGNSVPPEQHPITAIAELVVRTPKKELVKLQTALIGSLDHLLSLLAQDQLDELDAALGAAGITTFSDIRRRYRHQPEALRKPDGNSSKHENRVIKSTVSLGSGPFHGVDIAWPDALKAAIAKKRS